MHDDVLIPALTFPGVSQSKNSPPLDMRVLLYKGGPGTHSRLVANAINRGSLGRVVHERLDLVKQAHVVVTDKLTAGGSQATAISQFNNLRRFFTWAEDNGYCLTIPTVLITYINWTDHLVHRFQVAKTLSQYTVYTQGRSVGQVLDLALGRATPMIELTRLKEPKRRKPGQSAKADKQNLEATFAFGRLLQDICDGMSLSAILGPRPVRIPLHDGRELVQWARMHKKETSPERTPYRERSRLEQSARQQAAYNRDRSPLRRSTLVNFRILAELLMFIGQTGMNLAQANCLMLRHFSYASDVDGYKVRDYKFRRGGEVLFEIFKEYRYHFERYLKWRKTLFPDDLRLFPLLRAKGALETARPYFGPIQQACKDVDVVWHPPTGLRSTRVNWLLRRSGDPELTAEMAQHSKQTLLEVYEVPSQQRAMVEITRFWQAADPNLTRAPVLDAVAPGTCGGVPSALSFRPKMATPPDCIHPSGCLWCEHHRDIDSLDYVWALSCFRHLKILEVSRYKPTSGTKYTDHPGDYAISRTSEKLAWFRDSNATRHAWVEESFARIDEGNYHPEWQRLIDSVEGV
jgi:hypothetical protein